MVLSGLASNIPNPFGGFAPFPNSIMIPFMQAQSSALAFGFGIDYEYGKRLIKSMSNDVFNNLTSQEVNSIIKQRNDDILAQLKSELPQYTSFMSEIIDKQVEIEVAKAHRTPSAMAEIITALLSGGHEATAQAIETYVTGESQNKDIALQTLSLISPLFALMGLAHSATGTGDPEPTSGQLREWQSSGSSSTGFSVYWTGYREYSYDKSKSQQLLDTKQASIQALDDKYTQINQNQYDPNFPETTAIVQYSNSDYSTDFVQFFRLLDEWWHIKNNQTI